jgi:3D (Asp-Asp-Asp) domain-containing protein
MFKTQLVSAGIILVLLGSNIIVGNSYVHSNKQYESKIKQKTKLIKHHELSIRKQNEKITNQLGEVKLLREQNGNLKIELDSANKEKEQLQNRLSNMKYFEVTSYTAGIESTQKQKGDKGYGITTSGKTATVGETIACPSSFPFGTRLNIENIGLRVCEDRGGLIVQNRLDLYMGSLSEALKFGRQTLLVEILN